MASQVGRQLAAEVVGTGLVLGREVFVAGELLLDVVGADSHHRADAHRRLVGFVQDLCTAAFCALAHAVMNAGLASMKLVVAAPRS